MKTLALTLALVAISAGAALADNVTKEQCVDAHSRGQDAKEQGKLSLARKLFLTCAQSSCPGAVQGDCARFADDLSNLQPTIVLVARDGNGNDLPSTTVYIDGALVATTLDGRPIDIDPGSHTLKFQHGTKAEVLTVVIGSGEKGRTVSAKFGAPTPSVTAPAKEPASLVSQPARRPTSRTHHPVAAMPIAIAGGGVALIGAAIALYGRSQVPASCSLSTNQCSAPPGDPVFQKASDAAGTVNLGIVVGSIGAAALLGGLVWYVAGAETTRESPTQVAPIVTHESAGLAVSGRF